MSDDLLARGQCELCGLVRAHICQLTGIHLGLPFEPVLADHAKHLIAGLHDLAQHGSTRSDNTVINGDHAGMGERDALKTQVEAEKKARSSIKQNLSWFDKFTAAMKRAPKRLMAVIEDILRQPPEKQEHEQAAPERKRSQGLDI